MQSDRPPASTIAKAPIITTRASVPAELVREAVNRICVNPIFSNATSLKAFLRFAVERHLNDQDVDLKEYVIATSVFGRDESFDPAHNSIVRTQAVKLRAKLRLYYETAGREDTVVIRFHPGKYSPEVSFAQPAHRVSYDSETGPVTTGNQVQTSHIVQKLGLAKNGIAWWRQGQDTGRFVTAVTPAG